MEGTDATFTLVRTGTTAAELLVAVSVQETGSILTSPSDTTVTFAVNHSTTTLSVATDDDTVVEDSSEVTATITDDSAYTVDANAGAATVTVEDNDTAVFSLSVDSPSIAEADTGTATVTISVTNGVTFQSAQVIDITLGGSATVGSDYTFTGTYGRPVSKPFSLTLPAGGHEVTGIITAVNDDYESTVLSS